MPSTVQRMRIPVWDPLVRYDHSALVVAFAVAWLSAEEELGGPDRLHVSAGYAVGVIVAVRIIWGVFGTGHALFSDFADSPATAMRYLAELLRGQGRRYLGHSPAAADMIAAPLVCLAANVGTGLVAYADGGRGPIQTATGFVIAEAHAEEHEGRSETSGAWEAEP